jgi:glutaminyl-tRNA synthetase
VKCLGAERDASGRVTVVHCTYDPETRSGTPGADARKVKGNIHWLSARHSRAAEVRLYDRLFAVAHPGRAAQAEPSRASGASIALEDEASFDEPTERNYLDDLNRESKLLVNAYVEPAITDVPPETRYQFERHGYFVADLKDHRPGHPVFNRAVTLRDSWGREAAAKR